jgi:large subunit ribosomal protein L13
VRSKRGEIRGKREAIRGSAEELSLDPNSTHPLSCESVSVWPCSKPNAAEYMKTFTAKPADLTHDWHLVDAAGVPLGRLASSVAQLIRGKHKPTYTPHMDGGDFVVVVNASKVRLTGRKLTNKVYFSHTGYMGHERFTAARDLLAKHPERVIEKAVFGMLPKTSLAKQKLRGKLKVYAGAEHPHAAQQPKPFSITPSKASA